MPDAKIRKIEKIEKKDKKREASASELGVVMFLVTLLIIYSSRSLMFAALVALRTGDSNVFLEALKDGDPTIESIIVVGMLNLASGLIGFKLNDKVGQGNAGKVGKDEKTA